MEFAIAISDEADDLMGKALAGLSWITSHSDAMQPLQDNIQRIYEAIQNEANADDTSEIPT